MAVAVLHCKSDSVKCGVTYCAGDPHHLPRRPLGDHAQHIGRRLLHHLITQQVVHARPDGNHQRESAHLPTTTDASRKRPTIN